MPNPENPKGYLVDTSIFIHWFRGDKKARDFFHSTPLKIYYSKITRKELLRPPINDSEKQAIKRFLSRFRQINPDNRILQTFSNLLIEYPYLKDHLSDALIAATAITKGLILVTTNTRHFYPIKKLMVQDLLTTNAPLY